MVDLYGGSPPVHYANIVKGECNAKQKNTFFWVCLAEPPPILCKYSERRVQCKTKKHFFWVCFAEPPPILCKYSERRVQCKTKKHFFWVCLAEPPPMLCKYSERRVQCKTKNTFFWICLAEPPPDIIYCYADIHNFRWRQKTHRHQLLFMRAHKKHEFLSYFMVKCP